MADSSDEFESDLSCESEYESVESSDEWEPITDSLNLIGSTANCTLNLPLRKHIFFAGNSKLKITRSVKTISQPKRERCSLLVMGSWLTTRNDTFKGAAKQVNKQLADYCKQNDWNLIRHQNISIKSLNRGGLHLTKSGNELLFKNFVKHLKN